MQSLIEWEYSQSKVLELVENFPMGTFFYQEMLIHQNQLFKGKDQFQWNLHWEGEEVEVWPTCLGCGRFKSMLQIRQTRDLNSDLPHSQGSTLITRLFWGGLGLVFCETFQKVSCFVSMGMATNSKTLLFSTGWKICFPTNFIRFDQMWIRISQPAPKSDFKIIDFPLNIFRSCCKLLMGNSNFHKLIPSKLWCKLGMEDSSLS